MSNFLKKILIIHGPNLNKLGMRELDIYGSLSLSDINDQILLKSSELGFEVNIIQSNCEGKIIDTIHDAVCNIHGLIINPAGYTHTSVAISDALRLIDVPVVEVHLTNIYARESFRHKSVIASVVTGRILGFGAKSYLLALEYLASLC